MCLSSLLISHYFKLLNSLLLILKVLLAKTVKLNSWWLGGTHIKDNHCSFSFIIRVSNSGPHTVLSSIHVFYFTILCDNLPHYPFLHFQFSFFLLLVTIQQTLLHFQHLFSSHSPTKPNGPHTFLSPSISLLLRPPPRRLQLLPFHHLRRRRWAHRSWTFQLVLWQLRIWKSTTSTTSTEGANSSPEFRSISRLRHTCCPIRLRQPPRWLSGVSRQIPGFVFQNDSFVSETKTFGEYDSIHAY